MSNRQLIPVIWLLVVFGATPAFAQQVGVKAGINASSLTPLEDQDPEISRRLGPVAGVWVRTPLVGRLSFQGEGLFSEKGGEWAFGPDIEIKFRVRYFEVPLLARADLGAPDAGTRFFAVGGVAPAFKLSASTTTRFQGEERTVGDEDDFYTTDVGLVGGVGVEFGPVHVEGRYTHGLRHINTDDNGDEDRVRNRVISVTVGLRLR